MQTTTSRQIATEWVAQIQDRNGSTMFTTFGGSLTRDIEEAERFLTREMAEMFAQPSWNGIPATRIAALQMRGEAVAVAWA